MENRELLDSWSISGDDYATFAKAVKDITESTEVVDTTTSDLVLLSVVNEAAPSKELPTLTLHAHSTPQTVRKLRPSAANLDLEKYRASGLDETIIDETVNKSRMMIQLKGGLRSMDETNPTRGRTHFASRFLSRDLAARAALAGDAIYDITEERNAYLMSRYAVEPSECKAILRVSQMGGRTVRKVFALPSDTYCPVPQDILLEIVDALRKELGEMKCEHWHIDHNITMLWLSFPDKAKDISDVYGLPRTMVPGALLETSDTGDCSLRVYTAWSFGSSRSIFGVYQREHRGKFDPHEAVEKVSTELLKEYARLPERLCELLTIDVDEPDAALECAIKALTINDAFGGKSRPKAFSKLIGQKRTASLIETLKSELPKRKMTAYELAMMLLEYPHRVEDENVRRFFEKAAGSAPFLNWEKFAKATSSVTLAPAAAK